MQCVQSHLANSRIRPLVHREAEDVGRVRDRQLAVDAPRRVAGRRHGVAAHPHIATPGPTRWHQQGNGNVERLTDRKW